VERRCPFIISGIRITVSFSHQIFHYIHITYPAEGQATLGRENWLQ
jgi:hypothetical protein